MEGYHHRIAELSREHIAIAPYDERWPERYAEVEMRLERSLPLDLCSRIAHIGSTAVPGLSAKPIIDVQVEVCDPDRLRREVVPIMRELGYEYIWRPTMGEHAPYYAWFIARNARGERTEHIHMVEPDAATEARILFRDFLRTHPEEALRYEALKRSLNAAHPNDRAAYTNGKTSYITSIVTQARTASS
ncbi:MAG: GrpB family protein [Flavobacteriales bacterium]